MPVVFRYRGFRFYFYSNEGDPREPPHIPVRRGRDEEKFWLSLGDGTGAQGEAA